MNEAETRAEHIDPALKAAGWGVVDGSRVLREPTITLGRLQPGAGGGSKAGPSLRAKAEIADYVLVYRNTKLAVVEAKAWGKPLTEGVGQAKRYAAKLALPSAFATNGQAIYGIDMATGAEGEVPSYPTPDALWTLTFAEVNLWRDHFAGVPFEDKGGSSADPLYCVRVTANDGALGDQHLRDFQDNEKTIPTVLTTSQKLSTGVDARNVRNIVLMRPVASMIEFKQIIGRGTRLYDGKDHFTSYGFVKAHHHFNDPEWDGEPLAPDAPEPRPLRTGDGATDVPASEPVPPPQAPPAPARIQVRLADGKYRKIQHMTATTFWSAPDTRKALLAGLADKGFGREPLADLGRPDQVRRMFVGFQRHLYRRPTSRSSLPPPPA